MPLQASDIQIGRVYSAKRSSALGFFEPLLNDRAVRWIDSGRTLVQYDGPSVAQGRKYPVVTMEKFLSWARADVTDLCPKGRWRTPGVHEAQCQPSATASAGA